MAAALSIESRSATRPNRQRSTPLHPWEDMMRISTFAAPVVGLAATLAVSAASAQGFNSPGNILISDQFNNRVIEVNAFKQIVFSFGTGDPNTCTAGPGTIIAPNDVERLANGLTLMPGTGTGTCPDNRVIVVDPKGRIVFQYGKAGVAGSGPNELNVPVFAIQTPHGNFLITDQANNRIILVNPYKQILWSYGPTSGPGALNAPNSAVLLDNGHILIADENNSRAIEINKEGAITWQYSKGLNIVAFASRLPNGHTLITDSGNNRIIEVDQSSTVVFAYRTNHAVNSNPNPLPTGAVRLMNGYTLIADQFNNRVFTIDTSKRNVFQYGMTNIVGNGFNQLNAPYSANVVGDYTGLTPPAGIDGSFAVSGDDLKD
jgi:hypothetical protein